MLRARVRRSGQRFGHVPPRLQARPDVVRPRARVRIVLTSRNAGSRYCAAVEVKAERRAIRPRRCRVAGSERFYPDRMAARRQLLALQQVLVEFRFARVGTCPPSCATGETGEKHHIGECEHRRHEKLPFRSFGRRSLLPAGRGPANQYRSRGRGRQPNYEQASAAFSSRRGRVSHVRAPPPPVRARPRLPPPLWPSAQVGRRSAGLVVR